MFTNFFDKVLNFRYTWDSGIQKEALRTSLLSIASCMVLTWSSIGVREGEVQNVTIHQLLYYVSCTLR